MVFLVFGGSIPKRCKGVNCVDLGESFPTHICLQIWLRYSRERALSSVPALRVQIPQVSKIALLFSLMDLSEEKRLEYAALSMLVRVIGVASAQNKK